MPAWAIAVFHIRKPGKQKNGLFQGLCLGRTVHLGWIATEIIFGSGLGSVFGLILVMGARLGLKFWTGLVRYWDCQNPGLGLVQGFCLLFRLTKELVMFLYKNS